MVTRRHALIICSLGYGYLAKFLFKELCSSGVFGIGVSSKNIYCESNPYNFRSYYRNKIKEAIYFSTHLIITAPPDHKGCPILKNFSKIIAKTNIRNVVYISTTGVYGDHNGAWVDENTETKSLFSNDKNRIKAEIAWKKYCNKNNIILNICRVAGIYGPDRVINTLKKKKVIISKKNHFFSRIHVLDLARIISKILFSSQNDIWNLSDNTPSSREDFLMEIVKINKIKKYKIINFKKYEKFIPDKNKKFWLNNKKVCNKKMKNSLKYQFIFPSYKNGLRNLKEDL